MSSPPNRLDLFNSSAHSHVLLAFKYSDDAVNFDDSKLDPSNINIGDSVDGAGVNIVVINEFTNQRFTINEAIWDFDFIPKVGVSTTTSNGKIVVDDRYADYSFVNYLRNEVLDNIADGDLWALSHVTFMLKTFFSAGTDDERGDEFFSTNPYFFNLETLESVPTKNGVAPSKHIMYAIGVSNSLGLLRSFSTVYQLNITHKDGNLHNEVATGTSSSGLKTRSQENSLFKAARKRRVDASKPMQTLKDVFDAFEIDLNNQKYVHQAQLQQWVRQLRQETNTDKITVSPQQSKPPTPEQLPLDFKIDLDSVYRDYPVDNRNMPFEQPEVRQDINGIRSFPIKPGATIVEVIERLMLLSTRVGEDAARNPRFAYKIILTPILRPTNRYEINIKIRRYVLPVNRSDFNSGPGEAFEPIRFFVNDPENRDRDVISFKSKISYEVGDKMLEQQVTENIGAGVVYADREQPTAERRPDLSFFETMYSGIRPMIDVYSIDGLENAQNAGNIKNMLDPYTYTQTTEYEMIIRGNPDILSDLNRNPKDLIIDDPGRVVYYPEPEINPMYVKLTIFLNPKAAVGDTEVPQEFYYDNFYHVVRVVNMFGIIGNQRSFYQKFYLRRSDDLI